jgi:hypothetical protein
MAQKKDPAEQVTSLLLTLGGTADEVAARLRAHGCRGFRCGSMPCPVIRYVYRDFDDGSLTLIYEPAPEMEPRPGYFDLRLPTGQCNKVVIPTPVATFLSRFDDGAYPDLDLELTRS